MATSYAELPNKSVSAANGVDYAYRDTGESEVPLVLLQHFRGNLDSWDPALIDALATNRRVITFDNAGVGGSTGATTHTIEQMAHDAIAFITAMGFGQTDILGFSIGSFIPQEMDDRSIAAGRAIRPRSHRLPGPPAPTYIPSGLSTRLHAVSGWLPARSKNTS